MAKQKTHIELALEVGRLVEAKQKAYGDNAIVNISKLLQLLYPNGIKPAQYLEMSILVRLFDKLHRITSGNKKAFGESPWQDIVGYALRMLHIEKGGN